MSHAVRIESVVKRFGERTALDGLSFSVETGELFCLLGPNGSGKTTLFRILSTLLSPDEGSVSLAGFNALTQPADVRAHLGVVFQHPSLDEKLTVAENLRYGGNLYGLRGEPLRKRIAALASELHIESRLKDRVETLSGGWRRRVELAKSLLADASILLLDEPSTGVDPAARLDFWAFIDTLRKERGLTVIFTTHLMEEAERAGKVAIIDSGKLAVIDTPDALLKEAGPSTLRIASRHPAQAADILRQQFRLEPLVLENELRVRCAEGHEFVGRVAEKLGDLADSVALARVSMDDVFLLKTGRRFSES